MTRWEFGAMLDADLDGIYGVEMKFPLYFMCPLTKVAFDDLRYQSGTSRRQGQQGRA
ncbi:MAG: hypothetical protein ACHQ7H_18455 [Candidatus Rokuibacteriota bacterium]